MNTLTAIGIAFAYITISGVVGRAAFRHLASKCGSAEYCDAAVDHGFPAFWIGLAWPLVAPAAIGWGMTDGIADRSKRKQRKHDRKMEALRAKERADKAETEKGNQP